MTNSRNIVTSHLKVYLNIQTQRSEFTANVWWKCVPHWSTCITKDPFPLIVKFQNGRTSVLQDRLLKICSLTRESLLLFRGGPLMTACKPVVSHLKYIFHIGESKEQITYFCDSKERWVYSFIFWKWRNHFKKSKCYNLVHLHFVNFIMI